MQVLERTQVSRVGHKFSQAKVTSGTDLSPKFPMQPWGVSTNSFVGFLVFNSAYHLKLKLCIYIKHFSLFFLESSSEYPILLEMKV